MQKNAKHINKHCLVAGLQGGVGGPADLPASSGSATCSSHWKSQVHMTWVGFHCDYCELRGAGKIQMIYAVVARQWVQMCTSRDMEPK